MTSTNGKNLEGMRKLGEIDTGKKYILIPIYTKSHLVCMHDIGNATTDIITTTESNLKKSAFNSL